MPRKRRVSIDAVVTFKHQGKPVIVTVQRTQWLGGDKMLYFWKTQDGKTIQTEGVPKDVKVLDDVAGVVRKALWNQMAVRLASRPVVPVLAGDTRRKSAKRFVLHEDVIKEFRKEFLMLMKNVPKIGKDPQRLHVWGKATDHWGSRFGEFGHQLRDTLKSHSREGKPGAEALLDGMSPLWDFHFELGRVPERPHVEPTDVQSIRKRFLGPPTNLTEKDLEEYFRRRPPKTQEMADAESWGAWQGLVQKWAAKTKRLALGAWKYLRGLVAWAEGGRDSLELVEKDVENVRLEGFQMRFTGFSEGTEFAQSLLSSLKEGLRIYRERASKVFPWIVQNMLPLEVLWTSKIHGTQDAAAIYDHNSIRISLWGFTNPQRAAQVLAHEMGHHVYQTVLSGQQQKDWGTFIRGDWKRLDLREVLAGMRSGESLVQYGRRVEHEDPILTLQIETTLHNPAYSRLDLLSMGSIKEYLDQGGKPIIKVPAHPITGYAASNAEEAFCETLGNLVAFGPRTVPNLVIRWMRRMLPNLRTAKSDVALMAKRLASRPVVFIDFDETLAHAKRGGMAEQIASAERKVQVAQKMFDRKPDSPVVRKMTEKSKAELAQLQSSGLPEIEFSDGTSMVLHPRPGLKRFLGAVKSMATLYILSHGSPGYLAKAVPALGIEGYFKGVVSAKGGGGLPRSLPDRWVLVDDLSPGSAGVKVKLSMLGNMDPGRVVQVKPYLGGGDSALAGVVSEIRDRLQL